MNELLQGLHALVNGGMELAMSLGVPDLITTGVFYALGTVALLGALGVVFSAMSSTAPCR